MKIISVPWHCCYTLIDEQGMMLGDIQQRGDDSWGLDELDDVGSLDIRDYLQEDELYILDEPKTWLEVLVVTGYSKLQVLEYFGLNYEDPQTEALGHTKE